MMIEMSTGDGWTQSQWTVVMLPENEDFVCGSYDSGDLAHLLLLQHKTQKARMSETSVC